MNVAVSRDDLVPSPLFYHRLATSSIFRPLIDTYRDEDENQIYAANDAFLRARSSSSNSMLAVVQLSLKTLDLQWPLEAAGGVLGNILAVSRLVYYQRNMATCCPAKLSSDPFVMQ